MKDMEKIQRLIAIKEAFPQMDEETFNSLLNTIEDKELAGNIERITRGLRTEEFYKLVYQGLPWIKEITGLEQEQTSEQKERYQIPDYKLLVEDNNYGLFPLCVDVKNIEGDKQHCELMKSQVEGLKNYASNNKTIILIAIYWKKFNIWTHNAIENFKIKGKKYYISMFDAFSNDLSCVFGDLSFIIDKKFYRKTYYKKNGNINVVNHKDYGEIIKTLISFNNQDYLETEIFSNIVIDSMIKMNQIELLGNPENRIQVEESETMLMSKLSTWLIKFLETVGIEHYSDEVNGITYARYASIFVTKFVKKMHFKQSYGIPNIITSTSDRLYKLAFYKSDIYYNYLQQKYNEGIITTVEFKELLEHNMRILKKTIKHY